MNSTTRTRLAEATEAREQAQSDALSASSEVSKAEEALKAAQKAERLAWALVAAWQRIEKARIADRESEFKIRSIGQWHRHYNPHGRF